MGLVFNGGRSTQEAGALMGGGLDGLWQIAFPFDAKVMATGSKASEGDTAIGVIDFKQVRCWLGEGQAAANVL